MKKLTALIAAAALLGSTALAPAVYAPYQSGLTEISSPDLIAAKKKKKKKKKKKAKAAPKKKAELTGTIVLAQADKKDKKDKKDAPKDKKDKKDKK